jgi:hypothetical protein
MSSHRPAPCTYVDSSRPSAMIIREASSAAELHRFYDDCRHFGLTVGDIAYRDRVHDPARDSPQVSEGVSRRPMLPKCRAK